MIRVYADTSVYGGIFDEEFSKASVSFFELVKERQFELTVSAIECFRQGWQDAMTGNIQPISELWEGIDAE